MKQESAVETINVKTFLLDAKLPWEVARLLEKAARYVRAQQIQVQTLHLEHNSEYDIWSLSVYGKEDCWGRLKEKEQTQCGD